MSSALVDVMGAVAGGIWISAAMYFQMVRTRHVHPAYVGALFLIGVALMMGSAALAVRGPQTVEILAITGNALFAGLGIGVWIVLERAADIEIRKQVDTDQDSVH